MANAIIGATGGDSGPLQPPPRNPRGGGNPLEQLGTNPISIKPKTISKPKRVAITPKVSITKPIGTPTTTKPVGTTSARTSSSSSSKTGIAKTTPDQGISMKNVPPPSKSKSKEL